MEDFELVQDQATDMPAHKWYGKEEKTNEELMHDQGKGEPIVIRLFEFTFPPTLEVLPTKEQILTPEYIKHLQTQLWGDSLRLVAEPRVAIDKEGCKVFVPCQATNGNTFTEAPKLLQEWI